MSDSLQNILGVTAAVIGFVVIIPYWIDVVRGNSKPHRLAISIFFMLAIISFFGQLAEGATSSLWLPMIFMVNSGSIFLLSLKYGMGGSSKTDRVSMVLVLLTLVLWYLTKSSYLAIIFAVSINTIAKLLVMKKIWEFPYTELFLTWAFSALASFLALLSVGEFDFILLLPHAQNTITVSIIAILIVKRRQAIPIKN